MEQFKNKEPDLNSLNQNESSRLKIHLPRMATIDETVKFLEQSAKEANVKNCLTAYSLRKLALTNQIVTVRSGSKILINIDKLIEFLNTGSTLESKPKTSKTDKKYKTISRIEV